MTGKNKNIDKKTAPITILYRSYIPIYLKLVSQKLKLLHLTRSMKKRHD